MEEVPSILSELKALRSQQHADRALVGASNRSILNSIYELLWDRIDRVDALVHGQTDQGPDRIARNFRSFVRSARERTLPLRECDDGLASFTETAQRGYALHRRLDRFLVANFPSAADPEATKTDDWKAQCYAFLGLQVSRR